MIPQAIRTMLEKHSKQRKQIMALHFDLSKLCTWFEWWNINRRPTEPTYFLLKPWQWLRLIFEKYCDCSTSIDDR